MVTERKNECFLSVYLIVMVLLFYSPREFRKTSISALLTMPKPLTVWITMNCGKLIHTVKDFGIVSKAEVDAFHGTLLDYKKEEP